MLPQMLHDIRRSFLILRLVSYELIAAILFLELQDNEILIHYDLIQKYFLLKCISQITNERNLGWSKK